MNPLRIKISKFVSENRNRIEILFYGLIFISAVLVIIEIGFNLGNQIKLLSLIWNQITLIIFSLFLFAELSASQDIKKFLKGNKYSIFLSTVFFIDFALSFSIENIASYYKDALNGNLSKTEEIFFILTQIIVIITLFSGRFSMWYRFMSIRMSPVRLFSGAFLIMIFFGTFLLLLPNSTYQSISLLDALFTATSATCVTGLTVLDTIKNFTFTGQVIILSLIQLGGLGIMTITVFFILIGGQKTTIREMLITKELINVDSIENVNHYLFRVVKLTFFIEILGVIFLYFFFQENKNNIFESIFFSISAFCNAGFSLYSDSFMSQNNDTLPLSIISVLVLFGGFGGSTLIELVDYIKLSSEKRKRFHFSVQSKIILKSSLALLLIGAILIFLFESPNSMKEFSIVDQIKHSIFQSVISRTAGFNSIDVSAFLPPTFLILIVLMFIGGASGSTAGGIKVNTISVLYFNLRSILIGKSKTIIYHRHILDSIFKKSILIFILSLCFVMLIFFILVLTETDQDAIPLLFEVVSAFATVGLSSGVTQQLTSFGKTIIILTMFVGRIGIVSFALSFTVKKDLHETAYYPNEGVQVG